jgi:threonine synthase
MVGVFAGIPPAKLCKIRVHAPVVLQVAGGMDDAEEAIQSLARRGGWFNGEAFVNPSRASRNCRPSVASLRCPG